MKLFRKNLKSDSQRNASTIQERLSDAIDKRKHQLAELLTKQSEKLSLRSKKISLLFFGAVMGGVSLTLIVKPFQYSSADTSIISKERAVPIIITPPNHTEPLMSHEDYEMLLDFKQTMDSLWQYDRVTYEEALKGHEGLLDSIKFLISLYN